MVSGSLDSLGAGEETAIDGINNRLGCNTLATEKAAVKALDRIFAALNTVELQVNVALRVRIYRDVNNMAIFLFAFLANVVFQLLDPSFAFLSVNMSVSGLISISWGHEI